MDSSWEVSLLNLRKPTNFQCGGGVQLSEDDDDGSAWREDDERDDDSGGDDNVDDCRCWIMTIGKANAVVVVVGVLPNDVASHTSNAVFPNSLMFLVFRTR